MKNTAKKKNDLLKLETILSQIDDNQPIPYDDEDKAMGLHNPNNEEEVKKLFASAKITKCVGRPKQEKTKKATSLRIDEEILETFKATGKGWQTKVNEALHEWLDMQTWIENSKSFEVVNVAVLIESQMEKDSTKVTIQTVQNTKESNVKLNLNRLKVMNPQILENDNKLTPASTSIGRSIPIPVRRSRNQNLLSCTRFASILRKKADEKHSA